MLFCIQVQQHKDKNRQQVEYKENRWTNKKLDQSSHQWFDARTGLSFCAIWYKALIAFILNKGGFLSAVERQTKRDI